MRFGWILTLLAPPQLAFGGRSTPPPPPNSPAVPPPPPMLQQPQGEDAAQDVRRRAMAAQGYGSTIVTGPMGLADSPQLSKPMLGG